MQGAGLWQPPPRVGRAKRLHPTRARRPRTGELVQIDGSHHDWFEGPGDKCCLIACIDDATSKILAASFFAQETTVCWRQLNSAHLCQLNIDQGRDAVH
jgi:hypothetical protein